ncbi:CD109 antigen isoform X2 [Festucalex cinctus]
MAAIFPAAPARGRRAAVQDTARFVNLRHETIVFVSGRGRGTRSSCASSHPPQRGKKKQPGGTASLISSYPGDDPSYLLLVPRALRPGRPTSLSVSVLSDSPLTVTARILHGELALSSRTMLLAGGSTQLLTLPPAHLEESSSQFVLEVTGHDGSRHVFSNATRLDFEPRRCRTFIHTDKDSYRAGQLLRIRVLVLRDVSEPCDGSTDVLIKDPRGNLLRQWRDARPVLGVLSREFRLSREPPLGRWTVCVMTDGGATYKHVSVEGSAAPKFKVMLDLPDVLHRDDTLRGTVSARYKDGQPVRGHVNVTVVHHYHGWQEIYDELRQLDSSVDFEFALPDDYPTSGHHDGMYDDRQFLEVIANVTERHTGVVVGSRARVGVVEQAYQLYFDDYPKILKPSLSFTATVHVRKSNKRPLSREDTEKTLKVSVMQQGWRDEYADGGWRHPYANASVDTHFAIPADGAVFLHFLLSNDTRALSIHASLEDSYQMLQLFSSYTSPTHSYVRVRSASNAVEVGVPFTLYVDATFAPTGIHYVVKCGGDIVSAGNASSHRLTLLPEASWTPAVSVLVFLVREDGGEVANDVICLDVRPYLRSQVSLSWSEPVSRPGGDVTLRVSTAEAGSLVAILVQDQAPRWASSHRDVAKMLTMALREKDTEQLSTGNQYQYSQHGGTGDPLSVFTSCHLVVLTDAVVHASDPRTLTQEGQDLYPYYMDEQYQDEEDYMWDSDHCPPETWIWTETFTDDSGTAEMMVTVPDVMATWTAVAFVVSPTLGLGLVRTPAWLNVSKELLLSVHLPPVVTRGEEIVLEVRLFNNYHQELQALVTVVRNDTFELVLADDSQLAATRRVFVGKESGASVLVPIRPLVLGDVGVTVTAKSYVGVDVARGSVLVKAEGVEKSFSSSLLLDASSSSSGSASASVTFDFPHGVVPGSRRAWLTLVGDILGPSIQGLDSLIRLPSGCGEQNMIHFAPNIYVLLYLNATGQDDPDVRRTAVAYMESGYEGELSYRRADGSFSAFGESDPSGSTWLTAFVLRCFLQARAFIVIEERVVRTAAAWLAGRQAADGAFLEPGRVIHTEMRGGVDGPVSLTAYVLVALLEDPHVRAELGGQVSSALTFLESRLAAGGVASNYSLSLVAYALAMDGSGAAHDALDRLMGRADMQDGVPRWTSPAADLASSWQPSSTDIETAAYALLSLHKLGRLAEGGGLPGWLARQRNPAGGFGSTQDTVVALQALSTAAVSLHRHDVDMTVSGANGVVFHVNADNRRLLQTQRVEPEENIDLQVAAQGRGLALLQLNVLYNVRTDALGRRRRRGADSPGAFDVRVRLLDEGVDSHAYLDVCCSLAGGGGDGALNATGMALAEVGLLSGFSLAPDAVALDGFVKKVETSGGKVIVYLDSITTQVECVHIPLLVEFHVAKVQEAVVLVYDYYQPRRRTVQTYASGWREHLDSCWFCGHDCRECTGDDDWTDVSSASGLKLHPLPALLLVVLTTTTMMQQL